MPYRVDVESAGSSGFDRLIELGALDAELSADGRLAAVMPDRITPEQVASTLGVDSMSISSAVGRDDGSVWVLNTRPIQIGRLRIAPADFPPAAGVLRLNDSPAFGTGLHPTTALCVEAIDEAIQVSMPDSILDVGTGSGILALAALALGVPQALAVDTDHEALKVAAENSRLNTLEKRLELKRGGPDTVRGMWPLVVANIQAAPLIEMAPVLVQRVGHQGLLVLSGISTGVQGDVGGAYRRLGMRRLQTKSRAGWVVLVMQASW